MSTPLVIGLGNVDRGDDAVGAVVARAVVATGVPRLCLVECEDPTSLLDLWAGHDPVVVVDAVRSGGPPGTVHRFETGEGCPRLPERAWGATGRGGTHALGLAAAIELGRALHRLPPRLVVVGIEAAGFEHGAALSAPIAAAVPAAVAEVLGALEEVGVHVSR